MTAIEASRGPSVAGEHKGRFDERSAAVLVVVLLVTILMMAIFHNRFWAPGDEGNYAHTAERLLAGEILNRDIQDVHAGYINFVNAAAFSVFGIRLVSLRYPLAILTVIQSGLMFLLLRPRGLLSAGVGALTLASLGFVQFLNPTANWYCLFLAVVTVSWLRWGPAGRRERLLGTGFLVGTTFLFRQLSGVLLGIGVLIFLLLEWPRPAGTNSPSLARGLLLVVGGGLAAYLVQATDGLGWLLLGIWPFPILLFAWRRTSAPNRELLGALLTLFLGAAAAALPLIAYHLAHGSLGAWLADTVGSAVSLPRLDFMQRPGYTLMAVLAAHGLVVGDLAQRLNGALWLGLLSLAGVLGWTLLRSLLQRPAQLDMHPLPLIALFYSTISVHYQLPIYLFYTAGLSLTAVLWLTTEPAKTSRLPVLCCATALAAIALAYQAAMPLSRGLEGIVAGERRPLAPLRFARAGLYVDAEDAARYSRYVEVIEHQTQPGDTIFALPHGAILYFLTRRTNPFRFYNTALGIRSPADLDAVLNVLRCHPPKLVFYNSNDKYNTAASARIGRFVQGRYEQLTPLPPFEVFRRRNTPSGNGGGQGSCNEAGR